MLKNRVKKLGPYQEPFSLRMTRRDWRQALNSYPGYQISNGTIRSQTKFVSLITTFGIALLFFTYHKYEGNMASNVRLPKIIPYNRTYPLSFPKVLQSGLEYKIGIVADLDKESKTTRGDSWISYLLKGSLVWNRNKKKVVLYWNKEPTILTSGYGLNGRGMELSELVVFNGKLLTFDDRTGLVYEVKDDIVIPWVILTDGNGRINKGFKCEWAAVKDDCLYVGSMGKEWTSAKGVYINHNPMWVKKIHRNGEVEHLDWKDNYIKLRKAINIEFPGYVIHESATWSSVHRKWFFLPRRISRSRYDEEEDELRGTNVLMIADENFEKIDVKHIGAVIPVRGFSSFKFIPSTNDFVIIALKTEEFNGTLSTFITAFTIEGQNLLPETKISSTKYEGIEFI